VVGYDRLVGEHAYQQLTELYRALRLYVNCFQPSMKLLSKERYGKKQSRAQEHDAAQVLDQDRISKPMFMPVRERREA